MWGRSSLGHGTSCDAGCPGRVRRLGSATHPFRFPSRPRLDPLSPMSSPTAAHTSDAARIAEAHALRRALEPFSTLRALHAHPGWPALAARLPPPLGGGRGEGPPPG